MISTRAVCILLPHDMEPNGQTRARVIKLAELLRDKRNLLIVLQDHPDPDCLASAVALRKLVNTLSEVQCSLGYEGTVGRAENRALVKYLGLNLRACSELDFDKFDLIALVDTQPGTGNNSLPNTVTPQIVFDHHPMRKQTRTVPFTDIRKGYGATSTILLEYLLEAQIPLEPPLATALLYGIRSDTQDLGREASKADIEAIEHLYPRANKRMLSGIQRGKVPREYYQMLSDALKNARVQAGAIITDLGDVNNPDMIAEVADLLLRDDEAAWTMCLGSYRDKLLISIRSGEESKAAEEVIRKVVARKGTGGGHTTYAGGQIPLTKGTKTERQHLQKLVQRRFYKAIGAEAKLGSRLVRE